MPESLPLETSDVEFSHEQEKEDLLDYLAALEALEEFQETGEIRSLEEFAKDLGL